MKESNSSLSLKISKTDKVCPAGEKAGNRYREKGNIPVLSCEGPCIRGEIARVAAHLVAKEDPFKRGCHGELITVPGSAIAQWIKTAEKVVLIDGCFLRCHGRALEHLIGKEKLVQFDAYSFYKKYSEHFDIDAVPEAERRETARLVADAVLTALRQTNKSSAGSRADAKCGAAVSSDGPGSVATEPDCGCN